MYKSIRLERFNLNPTQNVLKTDEI